MNKLNNLINNPNLSITAKASELEATFADKVEDVIESYKREVTAKQLIDQTINAKGGGDE